MAGRRLHIRVLRAKNVYDAEIFSKQDARCSITVLGSTQTTKIHKGGGTNPSWDEELDFPTCEGEVAIVVERPKEPKSDVLGSTTLRAEDLITEAAKGKNPFDKAIPLNHGTKRRGEIFLRVHVIEPEATSEASAVVAVDPSQAEPETPTDAPATTHSQPEPSASTELPGMEQPIVSNLPEPLCTEPSSPEESAPLEQSVPPDPLHLPGTEPPAPTESATLELPVATMHPENSNATTLEEPKTPEPTPENTTLIAAPDDTLESNESKPAVATSSAEKPFDSIPAVAALAKAETVAAAAAGTVNTTDSAYCATPNDRYAAVPEASTPPPTSPPPSEPVGATEPLHLTDANAVVLVASTSGSPLPDTHPVLAPTNAPEATPLAKQGDGPVLPLVEDDTPSIDDPPVAVARTSSEATAAFCAAPVATTMEPAVEPESPVVTPILDANAPQAHVSAQPSAKPDASAFIEHIRPVFLQAHGQGLSFKDLFTPLDANCDGYLTPAEFVKGLQQLGPHFASLPSAAIAAVVNYFDTNGDGHVDYKEFLTFVHQVCYIDLRDELRGVIQQARRRGLDVPSIFNCIGAFGDDTVSFAEFGAALAQLGFQVQDRTLFDSFCRQLTGNGDSAIAVKEFLASMDSVEQAPDSLLSALKVQLQRAVAGGTDVGELFHSVDKDGVGAVSYDEFAACIKAVDLSTELKTDASLQVLIRRVDADARGTVEIAKFMSFAGLPYDPSVLVLRRLKQLLTAAARAGVNVAAAFHEFDKTHSGSLTPLELQAALASLQYPLSDTNFKHILSKVDGNGRVAYIELLHDCLGTHEEAVGETTEKPQLVTLVEGRAVKGFDIGQCQAHKDGSIKAFSPECSTALKQPAFTGATLDEQDTPHSMLETMFAKAAGRGVDVLQAFEQFDAAGTGVVSYTDVEAALRQLGGDRVWSAREIERILSHLDKNQAQAISLEYVRALMGLPMSPETHCRNLISKAAGQGESAAQSLAHFGPPAASQERLPHLSVGAAPPDEADRLIGAMNRGGTGDITAAELGEFGAPPGVRGDVVPHLPRTEQLRGHFPKATSPGVGLTSASAAGDKDKGGFVGPEEFVSAVEELGAEELLVETLPTFSQSIATTPVKAPLPPTTEAPPLLIGLGSLAVPPTYDVHSEWKRMFELRYEDAHVVTPPAADASAPKRRPVQKKHVTGHVERMRRNHAIALAETAASSTVPTEAAPSAAAPSTLISTTAKPTKVTARPSTATARPTAAAAKDSKRTAPISSGTRGAKAAVAAPEAVGASKRPASATTRKPRTTTTPEALAPTAAKPSKKEFFRSALVVALQAMTDSMHFAIRGQQDAPLPTTTAMWIVAAELQRVVDAFLATTAPATSTPSLPPLVESPEEQLAQRAHQCHLCVVAVAQHWCCDCSAALCAACLTDVGCQGERHQVERFMPENQAPVVLGATATAPLAAPPATGDRFREKAWVCLPLQLTPELSAVLATTKMQRESPKTLKQFCLVLRKQLELTPTAPTVAGFLDRSALSTWSPDHLRCFLDVVHVPSAMLFQHHVDGCAFSKLTPAALHDTFGLKGSFQLHRCLFYRALLVEMEAYRHRYGLPANISAPKKVAKKKPKPKPPASTWTASAMPPKPLSPPEPATSKSAPTACKPQTVARTKTMTNTTTKAPTTKAGMVPTTAMPPARAAKLKLHSAQDEALVASIQSGVNDLLATCGLATPSLPVPEAATPPLLTTTSVAELQADVAHLLRRFDALRASAATPELETLATEGDGLRLQLLSATPQELASAPIEAFRRLLDDMDTVITRPAKPVPREAKAPIAMTLWTYDMPAPVAKAMPTVTPGELQTGRRRKRRAGPCDYHPTAKPKPLPTHRREAKTAKPAVDDVAEFLAEETRIEPTEPTAAHDPLLFDASFIGLAPDRSRWQTLRDKQSAAPVDPDTAMATDLLLSPPSTVKSLRKRTPATRQAMALAAALPVVAEPEAAEKHTEWAKRIHAQFTALGDSNSLDAQR
ncbi:hypothetical protein ACHHYP_14890 [Achlya hypogyna]|uniref:Uncharacterized protein n=1 Tax=Achlya hypogyna TaxID=1202772 RepID=A0A1V9YC38_ACHHY|nr:hypothetical protein ACHHYP_14890 [Achlya hypogyna]